MTYWYRYTSHLVSNGIDEYGVRWGDPKIELQVSKYRVTKETPKGVWLDFYGTKKFVLRDARKRWACPTQEEARESFIHRKQRQIGILARQLDHAKAAERLARGVASEWYEETATITEKQWNGLKPETK
jgi:hypothetical protein